MKKQPLIISVISAKSGVGKTTLIEGAVKELKAQGYKVGVLKHDAHQINWDKEGKDSYRFTQAGAHVVALSSPNQIVMSMDVLEEESPEQVLALFPSVDIVLVEGYKNHRFPKIEVFRRLAMKEDELIYLSPRSCKEDFLAIAGDEEVETDIRQLPLNDHIAISRFIEEILENQGDDLKEGREIV